MKALATSLAIVVGAFLLIAIVATGTYLGNLASVRTQQREIAEQKAADDQKWGELSNSIMPTPIPDDDSPVQPL